MHPAWFDSYGDIDALKVVDVREPEPGPREALGAVTAAGTNAGEAPIRQVSIHERLPGDRMDASIDTFGGGYADLAIELGVTPLATTKEDRMSTTIPAHRLQLPDVASRQYAAMSRLERSIELDGPVAELIRIRASQLNGCAFCLDMHWKDARAAGESEERLYMLSAWRESDLFSDAERAALELCEAMTLISRAGVPGYVWVQAREHFEEAELAQLVFAITAINAWNRLMVASATEPGHYQPGMFGG